MKMETIAVSPGEDRVVLLFDAAATEAARGRVDDYLKAHDLSPRREYTEDRGGKDYLIYYFGHCYLEPHLDAMAAIAGKSG